MAGLELTDDITRALGSSVDDGRPVAVAYVGTDGLQHVSFRGSTRVHGPAQLAIWVRKQDDGLAQAVAERPQVALVYYKPGDPPGYLSLRGRARVAPEANDEVWAATHERERAQDPERGGIALIIDLDVAQGMGPDGFFHMERGAE